MTSEVTHPQKCDHRYVFLRSDTHEEFRGYQTTYTRIDYFFCEKCLEQRELRKTGSDRSQPEWFRAK